MIVNVWGTAQKCTMIINIWEIVQIVRWLLTRGEQYKVYDGLKGE